MTRQRAPLRRAARSNHVLTATALDTCSDERTSTPPYTYIDECLDEAGSVTATREHDAPIGEPIIEIRGLVKRYGEHIAVDGVDLTVRRNEIFGILGPNGAGKTTTLEMVEGLRVPDAGSVRVAGI